MMKYVFLLVIGLVLLSFQSKMILPEIYTKVKGLPYRQAIILDKLTLRKGIELESEDTSFQVMKYKLQYVVQEGDTFRKEFKGNKFYLDSIPALRKIKSNEVLYFDDVKVGNSRMTTWIRGIRIYVK